MAKKFDPVSVMGRLEKMRSIVKEELTHIPRGNKAQNLLRQIYNILRFKSFKEPEKTKEEVLAEAIEYVRLFYPIFTPKFDEKYFDAEMVWKFLKNLKKEKEKNSNVRVARRMSGY